MNWWVGLSWEGMWGNLWVAVGLLSQNQRDGGLPSMLHELHLLPLELLLSPGTLVPDRESLCNYAYRLGLPRGRGEAAIKRRQLAPSQLPTGLMKGGGLVLGRYAPSTSPTCLPMIPTPFTPFHQRGCPSSPYKHKLHYLDKES